MKNSVRAESWRQLPGPVAAAQAPVVSRRCRYKPNRCRLFDGERLHGFLVLVGNVEQGQVPINGQTHLLRMAADQLELGLMMPFLSLDGRLGLVLSPRPGKMHGDQSSHRPSHDRRRLPRRPHKGSKCKKIGWTAKSQSVNHVHEDCADCRGEGHDRGRQTQPSDLAAGCQRLLHPCNTFFKCLADRPSVHAGRFLEQQRRAILSCL